LIVADNQRQAVFDLEQAGVVINLGDAKSVSILTMSDKLKDLIENEKLRTQLSLSSLKLVPLSMQQNLVNIITNYNA